MHDEPVPLRLTAAAAYAGVSKATLHYAARAGEIPYDVLFGQRVFFTDELEAWAESRKAKVAA